MTRAVLLLVDLQHDFLERPGLSPPRTTVTARAAELLDGWRRLGLPVAHVHTVVDPDGGDRMPHWIQADVRQCVRGTPGAAPPPSLRPADDEPVFEKRSYSAFGAPELESWLAAREAGVVVLAGGYLHACLRSTALDAYERGLGVWIADDATASTEPVHAELTRDFLDGRAARFLLADEVLERCGRPRRPDPPAAERLPVACIGGAWRTPDRGSDRRLFRHHRPARTDEVIAEVPAGSTDDVAAAARAAAAAQPAWEALGVETRLATLARFARRLASREAELVDLLVDDIGKPRAEARAEVARALAHVDTALAVARASLARPPGDGGAVAVRDRPLGVVGLITPWNNPVAIPVGKLAPALAFGNAVVWKPDPRAPRCAMSVMTALLESGVDPGAVSLVFGDADTGRHVVASPDVDAVSLTGSLAAGDGAAALCARHGKPLQAELGGNNAVIVLADADLDRHAAGLAHAAFSCAGQRCTAIRRLIVERGFHDRFVEALTAAIADLRVGDPADEHTQVGPVISARHRSDIEAQLDLARAQGGVVACGGERPAGLGHGCWLLPTLVTGLAPSAHLVREESFGPVAVVLQADDLDHAIRLANDVDHGLVAGICTDDAGARERFAASARAGILQLAPGILDVDPRAPFGGWKRSGRGPPEHGRWDREAFARPQAVYGAGENGRA